MTRIQFKRGSFADLVSSALVPADGEPIWTNGSANDKGEKRLWVGDGGGLAGAQVGWWVGNTPGMIRTWYYHTTAAVTALGSGPAEPSRIVYLPIFIGDYDADSEWSNIETLSVNVTGAEAGKFVRLAIYDSRNGAPTNLLYESGNISVASTGFKTWSISGTARLPMGWYWLAVNNDTSTATFSRYTTTGTIGHMLGYSSLSTTVPNILVQVYTFGAFPSTASSLIPALSTPIVIWAKRYASTS